MSRIITDRLELWLMTEEFLSHCLENGDSARKPDWDMIIPMDWRDQSHFIRMRRDQYRENPEFQSWGVRAIVERASREMIGHIGFHTTPNPTYLQSYAEGTVEFGFSVYPRHHGKGFATEAARGLIAWAEKEKHQRCFIVSISPANGASQSIARKLGFNRIGSWNDPEDGVEEVYRLDV